MLKSFQKAQIYPCNSDELLPCLMGEPCLLIRHHRFLANWYLKSHKLWLISQE